MKANSIANISATPQRNVRRKRDDAGKPLTASQQRWYDACLKVASKIDGKVNLKEVCAAAGFSSTDSAHNAMQSLMRKGKLYKHDKSYYVRNGNHLIGKLLGCLDNAALGWLHSSGAMRIVLDDCWEKNLSTEAALQQ